MKGSGESRYSVSSGVLVQLAKKYLQESYTIEDITYLLGFSDHCAFRKAFKKWSGITPKEYREKVCAG